MDNQKRKQWGTGGEEGDGRVTVGQWSSAEAERVAVMEDAPGGTPMGRREEDG